MKKITIFEIHFCCVLQPQKLRSRVEGGVPTHLKKKKTYLKYIFVVASIPLDLGSCLKFRLDLTEFPCSCHTTDTCPTFLSLLQLWCPVVGAWGAHLLHCTSLHCTSLHCTAPQCTAVHCTSLHCTLLHCTAQHLTALHLALHCTLLCTAPHCFSAPGDRAEVTAETPPEYLKNARKGAEVFLDGNIGVLEYWRSDLWSIGDRRVSKNCNIP